MRDARTWVETGDTESFPKARIEDLGEGDGALDHTGVLVRIQVGNNTTPKSIPRSFPTLSAAETTILSGTAAGVLRIERDDSAPSFDVHLSLVTPSGTEERELEPEYLYPHKGLPPEIRVKDLSDVMGRRTAPKPSDRKKFHAAYFTFDEGRLLDLIGDRVGDALLTENEVIEFLKAHQVHAYGLASIGGDYRDSLLESWGVPKLKSRLGPGIRVGTDGMISSWARPLNLTHRGFNVNRIWLVLDFLDVEPDLGRKDFPPAVRELVDLLENPLADEIADLAEEYLLPRSDSGKPIETQPPHDKARQHREAPFGFRDLDAFGKLGIQSTPQEEQDVIALFNELRGLGPLRHFQLVFSSGQYAYDSFVEYVHGDCLAEMLSLFPSTGPAKFKHEGVLEFKFAGSQLLPDLVSETKKWSDMMFLVCWEIDKLEEATGGSSLSFSSVDSSPYCGVTHEARYSQNAESIVYVIELRSFLQRLC